MDMTTLFTMALGLQAPWEVKDLQFNGRGRDPGYPGPPRTDPCEHC